MKRSGFTLVELLIVILVIGILSTMIMMSSTEAVSSSRASNIVSNLRNVKAAALALYSDSIDTFLADPTTEISLDHVLPYLQSGTSMPDYSNFTVKNEKNKWFVYYNLHTDTADESHLIRKLRGRAQSAGLLESDSIKEPEKDTDGKGYKYYTDGAYVVMQIR